MSDFICTFLRTEVTCIPGILKKALGNYYNNGLCNAATWVFVLWCLLHYAFDKFLDAVFRKLKYKQYVRQRLKSSLWYLGFYGVALVYCSATMSREEIELFNFKRMSVPSKASLPVPAFVGYTLISTFYLHSSIWEGLKSGSKNAVMCYFFLAVICIFASIVKITETVFTFTAVISVGYVAVEITKILYTVSAKDRFVPKLFVGSIFAVTFLISLILHLIVIPLTFLIPLSLKLLSDFPSISLIIIYISLVSWSCVYLHRSIVYKLIDHWLYHSNVQNDLEGISTCPSKIFECVLFPPRNDFSYNIYMARKEAKIRQAKILAKRKPGRDRLSQTLRCVLAIKRKLEVKRKLTEIDIQTNVEETDDNSGSEKSKEELETEDEEDDSETTKSEISDKDFQSTKVEELQALPLNSKIGDENDCDKKSKIELEDEDNQVETSSSYEDEELERMTDETEFEKNDDVQDEKEKEPNSSVIQESEKHKSDIKED